MKIFTLLENSAWSGHPQEDCFEVSANIPAFAVADGVTLMMPEGNPYPENSGAFAAARIFCEEAVKSAESNYRHFSEKDIITAFFKANKAIADYNSAEGRVRGAINFADFDYFHATAALAVMKRRKIFWGTVCDSGVILIGKEGGRIFKSPPCNIKDWNYVGGQEELKNEDERTEFLHKNARNKLAGGKPVGYGILTGEDEAIKYLDYGFLEIKRGQVLFVYTDGFEHYLDLPDFLELFLKWQPDLKERVKEFSKSHSAYNAPKFGNERTLIAVKF